MLFFVLVTDDGRERPGRFQKPCLGVTGQVFYGPFMNEKDMMDFATSEWKNSNYRMLVFDGLKYLDIPHDPKELPDDKKRVPGNEDNWETDAEGNWHCKTCKAIILSSKVAHPIHTSPGAGYGECKYEDVGYCPNCEKKPNFSGYPVKEDGRPW